MAAPGSNNCDGRILHRGNTVCVKQADIAWLAGLFEGEGNLSIAKNGGTRLTIRMCDRDIIDKVNELYPCPTIQVVVPNPARHNYNQPRTQYAWRISDPAKVREFINLVLPWLGERRTAKALEVLHHLDTRPGTGGFHRAKTHCKQGHPYSPENTYVNPNRPTERHCKTCRAEWDRASRVRRLRGA
jgi:hypothetical protein